MEIATFTSGKYTQIGYKSGGKQKFKTIDSKFLYQDPDKLVGRYQKLLANLFGIKKLKKDVQLIFAISGNIDETKKEIVESKVLNDISFSKYFNGYNFIESFGFLADEKNIHLISDSRAVAFGALMNTKIKSKKPSFCLNIDDSISLMLIQDGVMISYNDALKTPSYKSSKDLIGDRGIDDILIRYEDNISNQYSQYLSTIISNILSASKDDGIYCKIFFIHTNKIEFIEKETIEKNFPTLNLYITDGVDQNKYLPLEGTFSYLNLIKILDRDPDKKLPSDVLKQFIAQNKYILPLAFIPPFNLIFLPGALIYAYYKMTKIIKIEFYSDKGKRKSSINSFEELKSHWSKTKPLAHGNSYYVIKYQNKTNIKVYLENLNSITDLQKYRDWVEDKTVEDPLEEN